MKKRRVLTESQIKTKSLILNIICIILTVLFTTVLISQLTMRAAVKQNSIDDAIKNIDYSKLMVRVSDEIIPFDKYINDYYIIDNTITDEEINELLKNSTASDFISLKYSELKQYLLGGSYKIPTITAEEIANLLDENKDMIYSNSSIKFLSDDHSELISSLEGPLKSFNASISESSAISTVKFAISLVILILSIVILCVILFVWSINYSSVQSKIYPAIRNFGITMFSVSVVMAIIMLVYSSNPTFITSYTSAVDLSDFGNKVFTKGFIISIITAVVGLAILIAGIFTSVHHKKTYIEESPDIEYNYKNKEDEGVFSILNQEDTEIETVYNSEDEIEFNPDDYYKEDDYADDYYDNSNSDKSTDSKENSVDELISEISTDINNSEEFKSVPDSAFEINSENKTSDEMIKESIADKVNEIKQMKQSKAVGKHEADSTNKSPDEKTHEEIVMPEITATAAIPVNGRVCPKCGKTNLSRNLFCSECGSLLK